MNYTGQKEEFGKYVRPNDQWHCSLDEMQSCGGSGTHLPREGQCVPQPSLRFQRGIVAISCTAVVLGLLLACWNSPARNDFLAPGPLTDSHAQILVAEGSNRCSSCHGAGDKTLGNWIRDAVSSGKHIPVSQSQLCMECHDQSLVAEFALHAHNVPPTELAVMTRNTTPTHQASGFPDPRNAAGQLACATCHREHHGADFNLSALTDNQCQTCHVNHFHSFERDHPEFTNWPFAKRTGIAFDHVSHGGKHFADKNESFDCRKCHVDDQDGNVKLVASFDLTCAKCHESSITGDQAPNWTLFQIPMLDTDALADAGYSVGLWPEDCQGDFDGQLPPAMKMLLMSDARTAAILNRHGRNFEFADLDPQNPDDLADAAALAWSIKELLFGLTVNGNQEIRERLQFTLESDLESSQLRGLTYGLHGSVFAQAQQRWIPQLLSEMTVRAKELNGNHRVLSNQVYARPAVQDHETLAENPLANLYQPRPDTQELPANDAPATGQAMDPEPNSTGPVDPVPNVRVENSEIANDDVRGRGQQDDQQTLPGERVPLAVNPLKGLDTGPLTEVPKAPSTNVPEEPSTIAETPTAESSGYMITDEDVRRAITKLASDTKGGWYRDDGAFKISYRVSEHIDPLIKNWTDLALHHHSNAVVLKSSLFDSLNSKLAAGQCRSCHTAEQQDGRGLVVNWQPKYRDTTVRGFTRFSHRPHDIQTSLGDCNSCHELDKSRSNYHLFDSLDDSAFISNFLPIRKSSCASCHQKGGASSGCVDCHNYHVGSKISGQK